MNIHKNARLTPRRREEMALGVIERRLTIAQAARAYDVSAKIVARWVERNKTGGSKAMARQEAGKVDSRVGTVNAVQNALEQGGVLFLSTNQDLGEGVRLRRPDL